ncbi:acyl-CoA thioesterase [Deinococcus sp.]|uniref:acyl-CoA thioesterase n=1 Tax=Deinococcus sp. TaxID=47478 RepID=UPI0025C2F8DF|nr:acyl-CoA thioesterase [Deinococcus sp.]
MTEKKLPAPLTPAPRSRARMLELVFPKDTNYHGTAFGGWVLALMDKVGSVAAVRHARGSVVTARSDAVDFHLPIRVGDAVALDARVIRVGRSSMTVQVDVYRETMASGEQQLATSGLFVYVALDENGRPRPVDPLLPEDDQDAADATSDGRP